MLSKNKLKYISLGLCATMIFSSCEKSLNINDNPNQATESSPDLVLPQALVNTSQILLSFNNYGGRIMYFANAGGVSGWGSGFLDYNYSTGNEAGLWSNSYNNLTDYQYVVSQADGNEALAAFYHAGNVMKAYNYANLVDTYNDIPYSEALLGNANIHPKYDKAEEIYADLASKLDAAVAWFKAGTVPASFVNADVLFKGQALDWARFANTLKLKLVIKGKGKVSFANESIDAIGIITDDAMVQPTFTKMDGKQNPMWNQWAYTASGASVGTWGTQFIPTHFVLSFYNGGKITDEDRADVTFANGVAVPKNQLGNQDNPPTGVAPSAWVLRPTTGTISATNYKGIGIIKGPSAAQPIMLLSEAKFLAAEAVVRGIMQGGNAKQLFEEGIKASYNYLYKNEGGVITATVSADDFLVTYKDNNETSSLVNFDLATTDEKKIESIITQKYIAFNFQFGHEAWNEFRRTGYPSIINPATNQPYPNNTANATNTFVSIGSVATTADKLPTRLLYPNTEFAYNEANVPQVDKFSSKIFWAK